MPALHPLVVIVVGGGGGPTKTNKMARPREQSTELISCDNPLHTDVCSHRDDKQKSPFLLLHESNDHRKGSMSTLLLFQFYEGNC